MSEPLTLDALREELENKRDRLRSQLDEVEHALSGLSLAIKHHRSPSNGRSRRQNAHINRIRLIIEETDAQFTKADIFRAYIHHHGEESIKEKTVSSLLAKLGEDGEIEIVKEGAGKRPALYRRKQSDPPSTELDTEVQNEATTPI